MNVIYVDGDQSANPTLKWLVDHNAQQSPPAQIFVAIAPNYKCRVETLRELEVKYSNLSVIVVTPYPNSADFMLVAEFQKQLLRKERHCKHILITADRAVRKTFNELAKMNGLGKRNLTIITDVELKDTDYSFLWRPIKDITVEPDLQLVNEAVKDQWNVNLDDDSVIITHKDGSAVVVKKENNERIAEEILARMALDLYANQQPSEHSSGSEQHSS